MSHRQGVSQRACYSTLYPVTVPCTLLQCPVPYYSTMLHVPCTLLQCPLYPVTVPCTLLQCPVSCYCSLYPVTVPCTLLQGAHCDECQPLYVGDPKDGGRCRSCYEFCHRHTAVCLSQLDFNRTLADPRLPLHSHNVRPPSPHRPTPPPPLPQCTSSLPSQTHASPSTWVCEGREDVHCGSGGGGVGL